ncbi:hypothetical protein [Gallaecimonas pentaromativorans]|nr:hypothetical protein [Gallaecimonas pentaromativorans]
MPKKPWASQTSLWWIGHHAKATSDSKPIRIPVGKTISNPIK